MWNSVFREHQQVSPMSLGFLQWDQHSEEQWGLGWREQAICNKCTCKSSMFNLFKEIVNKSPGRKAADINRGLQVGLTQVSIANAGLRKLLLSASIPAPSTKGMQKVSNKVLLRNCTRKYFGYEMSKTKAKTNKYCKGKST
ncbi:hypothetical protein ACJMK2_007458 [Sinanodonta woodiana]|uniref:Mutator-like transposase domain-containing protein n=1 Tax=Sinanodonta woodiana TaxID=1069815 RepID=A0ABD3VIL8_SINWO